MTEWVLILVVAASASYRSISVDHIPMATESACMETASRMGVRLKNVAGAWTLSCHRTGWTNPPP
jgi:hypothetical protein